MDDTPSKKEVDIAFLGFAERTAYVRDGNTNLFKWNILGLKQIIASPLFPMTLSGFHLGIALKNLPKDTELSLRIWQENVKEIGFLDIKLVEESTGASSFGLQPEGPSLLFPVDSWVTFFFPLGDTKIKVLEPGLYYIKHRTHDAEHIIGQVLFVLLNPPPLTPERIAAIRSDPHALKAIWIHFICNTCQEEIKAYAGLERDAKQESEGYIWYQDLPDVFKCGCGNVVIDLRTTKRNLYAPLGGFMLKTDKELRYSPLYERSSLETILTEFRELLNGEPREEALQKYLENNPILLHQFPSDKLYFKPPILTSFKADFAIVTPNKELILIEIEKGTTRLLKKDGGEAAPLRHAFDQVQSWLHVVDEHRLAVLDSLGIDRESVSSVRGVVIAGRDTGYDAGHLRRLKGIDRGRVSFLTYDDLGFSLAALIRKMREV